MNVGADEARIDREALAADQPFGHAALDRHLEQVAKQVAVAEAAVAVLREGRVIGHRARQIEPAEPAIGQIEVDLLAQPSLGTDAHAVADDQHSNHQLGVDRGATGLAVKGAKMFAKAVQIDEPVDRSQQMIRRHVILDAEAVKQRFLHHRPLAHHQQISR